MADPVPSCVIEEIEDVPMEPPANCIQVTPDGGVLKHVVKKGSGVAPVLHAKCLVHYKGMLAETGEVFMDTRADSHTGEPIMIIAGRDTTLREVGVNKAVSTMLPGERAWVYLTDPSYGYGEKGSFSFPSVPPDAKLVYEIDMIASEPPEEKTERRFMLFEERLEAAERRRLEGNTLFSAGKYTEALGKYALALSYCDEDFMIQLQGPHLDKAEAITFPIHLNMAAAHLKLEDWPAAAHNCTQVLLHEPKNVKALYRRGRARIGVGRYPEALVDLEAAAALAPDDKGIAKELAAARAAHKQDQKATATLFKGALGPRPDKVPGKGVSEAYAEDIAAEAHAAKAQAIMESRSAVEEAGGRKVGASAQRQQQQQKGLIAWLLALLAGFIGWVLSMLRGGQRQQAGKQE